MGPIEILDIIHHKNKYYTQEFFILNRRPEFKFDKTGKWLIGEDSGFFSFYYKNCDIYSKAFAGREFDIKLNDGKTIKASGQYWDGVPDDYKGLVHRVGCDTPEGLARCNVFCSYYIDFDLVKSARESMTPSNNYNKYNTKHADFGKHTIVSKW